LDFSLSNEYLEVNIESLLSKIFNDKVEVLF